MADPFRQGQKLSNISASEMNRIQSDARNRLGYGNQSGAAGDLPPLRGANVVVEGINEAGATLRAGHIIEIKGLANADNKSWMVNPVYLFGRPSVADGVVNFSAPMFLPMAENDDGAGGDEPDWPRHLGVIVDEQPVAPGAVAHAAIAGAVFARVHINNDDDKFANPLDNEFDSLTSVTNGLFRILGKQAGGEAGSVVNCAVIWSAAPPVEPEQGGGGDDPDDPDDPAEPTATLSAMSFGRVISIEPADGIGTPGHATIQPIYIDMDGSVSDIGEEIQAFIFTSF